MTNSPRRTRTDSTGNLHRILAGAAIELAPPAHVPLEAQDWPYWHSLVAEFAKADWTEHQLSLAAMLARTMATLEFEQRKLRAEGMVIERKSGVLVLNPRSRSVANLTSQMLAARRSLGLTARGKAGSTRDAVRQREANRRTERAAHGRDDLLA